MHSYDFLLQPLPGAGLELEVVLGALVSVGLEGRGAAGVVKLEPGEFTVRPLFEGGVARALELNVPLAEETRALEAAMSWALGAASAARLRVFDPQTGTLVTGLGGPSVDAYLRAARYAGEYGGAVEAIGLSSLAQPSPSSSPGGRLLLALLVFFLVAWGTFRVASHLRASRPAPPASPRR